MTDHERIEELLAVRALDGLDPDGVVELDRALADHGPGCETCARLEREYTDVAGRLAAGLEPVPVREGLEDEVVVRALASTPAVSATPPGEVTPISKARSRRTSGGWRRLSFVAGAAAFLVAGWVLRDVTLPDTSAPPTGFLAEASIVPFEGSGPGRLAIAYRPGRPGAYLVGAGIPAPAEGEVYELWLFEGDRPVSGGCFSPQDGRVVAEVEGAVHSADLLAVTVEAATCPAAPTTDPVLTATPSPAPSSV
jgi:hypothetical protein